MAEQQREDEPSLVQLEEEYTVWKKNSPFLYDLIISHPIEWPSLTVQWVPQPPTHTSDSSFAVQKLVFGTHTSSGVPNFLMVADAHLPSKASEANINGDAENPLTPKVRVFFFWCGFYACFGELFCGCLVFLWIVLWVFLYFDIFMNFLCVPSVC